MKGESSFLKPLRRGETFRFACHPGVPCFTECCRDLRLMLTPYDVLKLAEGLKMSVSDFVDNYTNLEFMEPSGFPVLFLAMRNDEKRRCPFVTNEGCSVYPYRPSACRIYPVARATKVHPVHGTLIENFFLIRENHCRGFEENKEWTIDEWLQDQELKNYLTLNDCWTRIVMHPNLKKGLTEAQRRFAYILCYDHDKLAKMLSSDKVRSTFGLTEKAIFSLMEDSDKLLHFVFNWLAMSLLGR